MTTSTPRDRRATRGGSRRPAALGALGAVCAVVLSGCVKLDMAITLHSDDTASGTVVYAIQDSAAKALGQDPEDLLTQGAEGEDPATDFGEGATSAPYQADGYTGTKITFKGTSIDKLGEGSDADALTIKRDGDEFVVSGKLDLTELADDSGDTGDTGSLVSPDQIASLFDVKISVTFPGEVVSADKSAKIDGNTVTWTSDDGTVLNLDARGKATGDGGGGVPVWVWILIGVVVLAVAAAVVFALTRRGRPGDAPTDGEAAPSGAAPRVEPTPPTQPLPPAARPAEGEPPPPPPPPS